jgi:hypothetical protein
MASNITHAKPPSRQDPVPEPMVRQAAAEAMFASMAALPKVRGETSVAIEFDRYEVSGLFQHPFNT